MPNKDKTDAIKKQRVHFLLLFLYHYFYFLTLLSVAVIIIAGFFVLLMPKYKAISEEVTARDEEKRLELDYLNKYQIELAKYNSSYEKISAEDREKVRKIYPKLEDIEEIFSELAVLVKKNGLLLNSVELKKAEDVKDKQVITKQVAAAKEEAAGENAIPVLPDDIGVIEINIDISGANYKSLKNILRTFENNLRILDIKDLSFESGNSLSLKIKTYYDKSDSQ